MTALSPRTFAGPARTVAVLASLLAASAWPLNATAAGIEGISYTLTPSYDIVRWSDELGLKDTELWGGRTSINFGKYISLQGYYLLRDNVDTDLATLNLVDAMGQPLVDQNVDIRNYGTDVVMNLGRGTAVPFLKAGAGVLHLETPDGDKTDQINLKLGGGFRFGIDRFRAVVWAEDSAMRLDRYDLAVNAATDPPFPSDPDSDKLRHSLTVGAGLDFELGGYTGDDLTDIDRAVAQRFQSGLRGVSVPIEPFAGTIRYDDAVGLSSQEFVGLRTGLDFGPFFGLRGYYWKGVNHDFDDTDPIHSFGGEAQFNLNAGQGGIPYLVVGAGQLAFEGDFREATGAARDDKTMLILGGGVGFTLGDRVLLDVSVRDYLFSDENLEDVSSTDQLTNNVVLAVGARFSFGASHGAGRRPEPVVDVPVVEPVPTTVAAVTEPAPTDAPATEVAPTDAPAVVSGTPGMEAPSAPTAAPAQPAAVETTNFHGERQVSIPVPTQGEIYVRYGRPGGVEIESRFEGREPAETTTQVRPAERAPATSEAMSAAPAGPNPEMIRSVIRDELRALEARREPAPAPAPAAPAPTPVPADRAAVDEGAYGGLTSSQQLELLERRLAERIDSRIDTRLQRVEDRADQRPDTIVVRDAQPGVTVVGTGTSTEVAERHEWKPQSARFYLGANVNDPDQVVIGGRVDMGPLAPGSNVHFVPELGLGFGSGATSLLLAGNLRYDFRKTDQRGAWTPYVSIGGGLLGFTEEVDGRVTQEGVLNLSYGLTANIGRVVAFAEHQGIDLYDLHRINLGMKWKFGK